MELIRSIPDMQAWPYPAQAKVGFVPTMGFLHEGHLSLVDVARRDCDVVAVSIFVNPAQFGPHEDLESYPRDLKRDLDLLESRGVDLVFLPEAATMYPKGYRSWVEVEELSDLLCGASRPGHFRGVCTVVLKLINIVSPDRIYMGEKDFQQLTILRQMTNDLNIPVEIVGCPIIREKDGLAQSSRNVYLSEEQRHSASSLYRAIMQARKMVANGITQSVKLIDEASQILIESGAELDYVKIVSSDDLSEQDIVEAASRIVIAVRFGKTRLIDNMLLKA